MIIRNFYSLSDTTTYDTEYINTQKLSRAFSCLKIAKKRETLSNNKEFSLFYCFSPAIFAI